VRYALILFALGIGCGGTPIEDHPCPPNMPHTYENFGRRFFTEHCFRCHGGSGGYSSRTFTSLQSIRDNKDRIFLNSALDNTAMPPGPDDPPESERRALADWLACGAPQ